jgi:BASS family bile acid:Na+ symporter
MEANSVAQHLGSLLIFTMMLGMGMSMVWEDVRRVVVYPRAVMIGIFCQMMMLPAMGWLLLMVYPQDPAIACGLMILTFCPGGVGSNMFSLLAKGDAALAVTLTFVSSCLIVLSLPPLVNATLSHFMGTQLNQALPMWDTIQRLFSLTLLPIASGMLLKRLWPAFTTKSLPYIKLGGFVLISLLITGLVIKDFSKMLGYAQRAGLITLILGTSTMLLGFFIGTISRLNKAQSLTIAIEVGMHNSALGIVIAQMIGNPDMTIVPIIYTLVAALICFGLVLSAHWPALKLQLQQRKEPA